MAVRIAASLAFEARNTTAARRLGMRIWLTSLSTKVMTSPGSRTAIRIIIPRRCPPRMRMRLYVGQA
ncbi:Uncharacterised protein [Mycobacterium tuberculosis]|uniref:Uncharacterized protein n=1 Tax=Mycobacterium tuberculosis TaxID=1773 RepID=A0A0U0QPK5_MYCTX|nr:Uncharacterised protein [Mycobacterium tuberculosis]CKU66176.1 Uncharacterised protein [Mycobacterium tuberculosis]COV18556.1 Uncharacterised protein [Mycobacterium tuberculosis]COW50533.1 Uncharacterised protein [Mycobacterium tuberculosis]COX13303.1 Uncharacterised protein [Mycobacterium tuberculosis]